MNVKEIKSIELSSYTTMTTVISVIFSIIAAIILSIMITLLVPGGESIILYLIPTIIVGSFMWGIYNNFCEGLFYNLLAKKLKTIAIAIEENQIVKISTTETAMMVAIITTIQIILIYLVSVFILPMFLTSIMQTLMISGQQTIAYSIYQLLLIISQPTTIAMFIFGTFIITFVLILLGTYIYNFIAKSGRGIVLNLNKENNMTIIDSIDSLKLAIASAIVCGVLSIITGAISVVSGGSIINLIESILSGFVGGFISTYLIAVFYNYLSPKIGKIKLELIDFKIN